MAEVLIQIDGPLADRTGRTYVARICGARAADNLWDGWIEFTPTDGGDTLRTPRETKQPKRTDLEYWAGGLSMAYLEGALTRALDPSLPDLRPDQVAASPAYSQPAPSRLSESAATPSRRANTVLDPFEVYRQGEAVLLQELLALGEGHLQNIIQEYDLMDLSAVNARAIGRQALAELIVAAVRRRSA
jgi:hypothetical protein